MTHLRKLMLDELQRRNYAQNTVRACILLTTRLLARVVEITSPEHNFRIGCKD